MGNAKYAATRLTMSIGVAVLLVMATVVPVASASSSEVPPDRTALMVCGTTCPTPDDFWVEAFRNQFIAPTHPGQDIEYVKVTTPEEFWPLTGILRLLGLALGPPELFGPGGVAWPDEPLWKLSGLFDLTADQSLRAGVADLETAMAKHGNDHLVIHGESQGAGIANVEKRKLAEQYPAGTKAPDIDFVLNGDPNLPNGGLASRFPGLYIPILDLSFNGPAPTDTQFDTVEINQQYDGFTDLPLYPLNVISLLNAVLGIVYVHLYPLDNSLPAEPTKSPAYQGTHGDTTYYFFPTEDLPLFGPLRTLGVPELLIDVVEPFFRVLVDLGYDRSIPPWEPTPARLIPPLHPVKVAADLVTAIGEGINNAAALIGLPPLLSIPAARTETTTADVSDETTTRQQITDTDQTTTRQQATEIDQTTTRQQATEVPLNETTTGQQATDIDKTTTGQQATQTDQTTIRQQATDTDQATTPTVSTSKPWKRAGRHEMSRHVVRGPLGVYGHQTRGLHSGDTDAPIAQTPAGGDVATTPNTASPESPSGDGSPGARSTHREHRQGGQPGHPAQNAQP